MRYGPGQAIRCPKVCDDEGERCWNGSTFYECVEKTSHVLLRAVEIGRGSRTPESRQIRRETVVVIPQSLYHAAPQLSRVGSTMKEEKRGTSTTICQIDVDPLNHEWHILLLRSRCSEPLLRSKGSSTPASEWSCQMPL